jgi:hypothetical protein
LYKHTLHDLYIFILSKCKSNYSVYKHYQTNRMIQILMRLIFYWISVISFLGVGELEDTNLNAFDFLLNFCNFFSGGRWIAYLYLPVDLIMFINTVISFLGDLVPFWLIWLWIWLLTTQLQKERNRIKLTPNFRSIFEFGQFSVS